MFRSCFSSGHSHPGPPPSCSESMVRSNTRASSRACMVGSSLGASEVGVVPDFTNATGLSPRFAISCSAPSTLSTAAAGARLGRLATGRTDSPIALVVGSTGVSGGGMGVETTTANFCMRAGSAIKQKRFIADNGTWLNPLSTLSEITYIPGGRPKSGLRQTTRTLISTCAQS